MVTPILCWLDSNPKSPSDDAFWFPHAASQAGPVTDIQELLWPAMENSFQEKTIYPIGNGAPFIDGLPIKNGDFPWLC